MRYLKRFRLFENADSGFTIQDVVNFGYTSNIFFDIYNKFKKGDSLDELNLFINNMSNMTQDQLVKEYGISDENAKRLYDSFEGLKEKSKEKIDLVNYSQEVREVNLTSGDEFPESEIKKVVWRAGEIKFDPMSGGTWFTETKDGAEKFALSVRREKREAKAYYINLQNPFYFDLFWHGYIKEVEKRGFSLKDEFGGDYIKYNRLQLMKDLEKQGHDGIIIGNDTWNDTGDSDTEVKSEQYIVFDPKNIRLVKK